MRRRNSCTSGIMLLTFCLAAAGCKKEQPPAPVPPPPPKAAAPAPPVQAKASSAKSAAAQAVQKQQSSLRHTLPVGTVLDFSAKKDPFKPFLVEPVIPATPSASKRGRDILPIQGYDINKYRIAGIVAGLKENRALVIDPLGKGYVVKTGMLIGNNNGRITRITGNAVEVLESFRDDNGVARERTVKLTLPQKK
jgi:type IV pilus assembly protein PilP